MTDQPNNQKPVESVVAPTPAPVRKEDIPPKAEERSPEDLIASFESVMMEVNKGIQQLRRFESAHPYLIAPNIYRCWEEGLKETALMMSREFSRLREQRDRGDLEDLLNGTQN